MNNPLIVRGIKLAAVAAGIAGLAAFISTFLPDRFRWFMWGFSTSLLLMILYSFWNWHRRGTGPAEVNPDNAVKSHRITRLTVIGIAVGGGGAVAVQLLPDFGTFLVWGLVLGLFAALGLILSPLFYEPAKPKGPFKPDHYRY